MRKEKDLIELLRGLVKLLGEEVDRNPRFADQIDALLSPIQSSVTRNRQRGPRSTAQDLPDIHAEFASRGESDFRIWLRDQPIAVLRALIRLHDFDATRRTPKWKDPEKLSTFISDQIRSRLARGSSFLTAADSSGTDG